MDPKETANDLLRNTELPPGASHQSPPNMLNYENPVEAARANHLDGTKRRFFSVGKVEDNAFSFSMAGSLFFSLLTLNSRQYVDGPIEFFAVLMLACMAIGIGCCIACFRDPSLRRITRWHWLPGLIAIGLSLLFSTNVQSCPHATYLRFGPWLLAINGKSCNNLQPLLFWWSSRR